MDNVLSSWESPDGSKDVVSVGNTEHNSLGEKQTRKFNTQIAFVEANDAVSLSTYHLLDFVFIERRGAFITFTEALCKTDGFKFGVLIDILAMGPTSIGTAPLSNTYYTYHLKVVPA